MNIVLILKIAVIILGLAAATLILWLLAVAYGQALLDKAKADEGWEDEF